MASFVLQIYIQTHTNSNFIEIALNQSQTGQDNVRAPGNFGNFLQLNFELGSMRRPHPSTDWTAGKATFPSVTS